MLRCFAIIVCGLLLSSGCAEPKAIGAPEHTSPDATQESTDGVDDPCVKACTDARRMEAMDWSVIVNECEATCARR